MARTSARSGIARRQASSPSKSSDRHSQSPVRWRLRSQSVDLDADNDVPSTRRGVKRGDRQSSAESDISDGSVASNRKGRSRKAVRAVLADPELSMVAEDQEQLEHQPPDEEQDLAHGQRSQSIGALSQMSGTTAISARTSDTQAAIDELDVDELVKCLAGLLRSSEKILQLLAPPNSTAEDIQRIVKDLQVPGEKIGKLLKREEEFFDITRKEFGPEDYDKDHYVYIRIHRILRKLFGPGDVPSGDCRPDAILQAANLATLVRHFAVLQRERANLNKYLDGLDEAFPQFFVSPSEDSALKEESFQTALEICTQVTITDLRDGRDRVNWNPDKTLSDYFFHAPTPQPPSNSYFKEFYKNGVVKPIMGLGSANSKAQEIIIKARVLEIRKAFHPDASAVSDAVNFDYLEEQFLWSSFVTRLVQWSRLRFDEITFNLWGQGGIDNIIKSLVATIRANDPEADISYYPTPSRYMGAKIKPAIRGQSFAGRNKTLHEKLKQYQSNSSPAAALAEPQEYDNDDAIPDLDNGGKGIRSTEEYLSKWKAKGKDKNKENIREKAPPKQRLIDPQPDARKIIFTEDYSDGDPGPSTRPGPSGGKQYHDNDENSELSDDQGFEDDRRVPNPQKRTTAPPAARPPPPSPKRPRVEDESDDEEEFRRVAGNRKRAEEALQASLSSRAVSNDDDVDDDDVDDDDENVPVSTQVRVQARVNTAMSKPHRPQKRFPWSPEDEQHLIDLIEEKGCSWSVIQRMGGFKRQVDQVGLKDKARNLKVSFLKSRITLPENFERIPLGAKEIANVRKVIPNYEQ